MKILIAVPTFETISPDTFKSIYELDKGEHDCCFEYVRGYDCAAARNEIARIAINESADYVLMVDNDIVLQTDTLQNFLDEPFDVCLGLCAHRNTENVYGGKTTIYRNGELNYSMRYPAIELTEMRNRGDYKLQVHGGGMACAFIKTEVFRRIKYPWFKWVNYDNGDILSEDLYFCEQCNQAEIPIYADTRVVCGHIFRHVQWAFS